MAKINIMRILVPSEYASDDEKLKPEIRAIVEAMARIEWGVTVFGEELSIKCADAVGPHYSAKAFTELWFEKSKDAIEYAQQFIVNDGWEW